MFLVSTVSPECQDYREQLFFSQKKKFKELFGNLESLPNEIGIALK